jgi:hypothetical protein
VADELDDLSNNLTVDLGPFLVPFGDLMSREYRRIAQRVLGNAMSLY